MNAPEASAPSTPAARDSAAKISASATAASREADILQRARRLARERPVDALRLLDEHQRRFADGMLAPEREVLAIEILRALSRRYAARARLQSFREHYPTSVYLEYLDHLSPRRD